MTREQQTVFTETTKKRKEAVAEEWRKEMH